MAGHFPRHRCQDAALRLYQAAGFMDVGRMPPALKVGPNDFDELMMVRNT